MYNIVKLYIARIIVRDMLLSKKNIYETINETLKNVNSQFTNPTHCNLFDNIEIITVQLIPITYNRSLSEETPKRLNNITYYILYKMERDKDGDRKHRQKSPMGSFATPHRFSRRTLSHSSRNISYELASMESIPPQTTPPQATTYQSETPQSESSQSEWYSADSRSAIDLSESLQSDIQQAELLRTPEQSAPSQITQWRSAPPQIIQWRPAQQQTLPWQSAPPQPRLHYIAPLQYIQVQQPYHSYSTWHHAQVQPEQIEWQPELSQTGTYQPITLVQASPQPYALPQVELSQTGTYQPIRPVQASPQPYALPQVELSQTGTYQPIRPAQAQPQPYALPQVELSQTGTYQPIRPAQAQPQPYALPQVELSQTGTYQPIRPAQAQPQPYALPQVELPQPSPSKPESLQSSSYQHALPQVELPQPSPSKPESLQSSSYQHAPSQFELSQPGPSLSRLQQPEQAELVQQSQTCACNMCIHAVLNNNSNERILYISNHKFHIYQKHINSTSFKSRAEGIMDPSEEVDVNAEPKEIQKGDIICKLAMGKQNKGFMIKKTLILKICQMARNTSSKEIKLQTNYFKVISPPNWTLHQYNIIFPRNLSIQDRKLAVHFIKKRLGIYSFNGHVLYIHHRAFENIIFQDNEEIESQISDGELITLKIKYKGIVNINDRNHMQFFNVIIKSCLEKIELFLMRRNYYDLRNNCLQTYRIFLFIYLSQLFYEPSSCSINQISVVSRLYVRLDNYNLEVWPGFFTSIRRHQRNILMCVDIIHKIRPLDTLLDIWERCKSSENVNPQILFYEKVKESVIITNHNNIMYRIKDVNFLLTPKDTFTNLKSKKVETYQDYYKDRYKISLRDSEQPMLLATGIQKTRNLPNQMKNLVYLIPELCCPTSEYI
ncbi:piwi-like protein Siwi isoform X1 [Vespula squamosa]|uniref:Piwi-like protein Siwi isoform X1 n=1 Tax=Vespula squamosa TaxID=30214 RepID=A0ABD1ZU01_VESSQ